MLQVIGLGFTEISFEDDTITISHGGNMGNTEDSIRENVDKLVGKGMFDKWMNDPSGRFYADKHNTHDDPSYSWIWIVDK